MTTQVVNLILLLTATAITLVSAGNLQEGFGKRGIFPVEQISPRVGGGFSVVEGDFRPMTPPNPPEKRGIFKVCGGVEGNFTTNL